jgi:hypothetical protein
MAFSKLKALLRNAVTRIVGGLLDRIGESIACSHTSNFRT